MAERKELSVQEDLFLEYLFDGENVRHPNEAKQMAGYAKDYPLSKILKNITEDLVKRCDNYLAMYAPQGIVGLLNVMANPTEPGAKIKLQAVQDLLNRAGVVAKEKTEVQQASQHFLFVLPEKRELKDANENNNN